MKQIEIINVTTEALHEISTLNEANLPHVNSISIDDFKYLHGQSKYFRLALVDGAVAGFLLALTPEAKYESMNFKWFQSRYSDFFYIDRIVIREGYRDLGLGSKLYADLATFARENSAKLLSCEYNLVPKNEVSAKFHQKNGFFEVGQQQTEAGKKTVSLQIKELF